MTDRRFAAAGRSREAAANAEAESALAPLAELRRIVAAAGAYAQWRVLGEVGVTGRASASASAMSFPLVAVAFGNPQPGATALGFFGGVHGLERIGTEVVLEYLRSVVARLSWDALLHRQLESMRLVFMPVVNPGGMWRGTRANPRGVDLMRNAPLDADGRVPFFVGGQRISAALPWYRGAAGAPLEAESAALCRLVEEELLSHVFSAAIDCHSGFGLTDRVWFPFAHSRQPIPHLPEVHALKRIFDAAHPHHPYVFEPQSRQYLAHGDLWDWLYLRACADPQRVFLPLTLEMGSWLWVKKNPRQLFSRLGIFNPLIEHRQRRVLRRHVQLLDFVARALHSQALWLPRGARREEQRRQALALWYAPGGGTVA